MDRKTVGLVGAISALTPLTAAPVEARSLDAAMSPRSYAELLQPVPNAAALLKEMDARPAKQTHPAIQAAQYYYDHPYYGGGYGYGYGYYPRRRWYHHHQHHHHWNGGWGGYGWGHSGGGWGRPRYNHHHHHDDWD